MPFAPQTLPLAAFTADHFRDPLIWFGFAGQGVFMMRFLVQWYATERRGRSVVPIAFWWLSLAGGVSLLTYSWLRNEPVLFFAQMLGLPIYARNLWLIYARRWRTLARRKAERESVGAPLASTPGTSDTFAVVVPIPGESI